MKLLFAIVNYRTDEPLARLLDSVREAATRAATQLTVEVVVVDNSQRAATTEAAFSAQMSAHFPDSQVIFAAQNLGYFGALPLIQEQAAARKADVIVVSNADVVIADDFFAQLARVTPTAAAVVAPAIISEDGNGFDQNPKHVGRRSGSDLRLLRLIYSRRATFYAQQLLGHFKEVLRTRRKGHRQPASQPHSPIYAAHGALFVFTKAAFFLSLPPFEPFLFGEELFVAEEALNKGETTIYEPAMRVYDSRHASTAELGTERRRKLMLASIDFILCRYY